MCVFSMISDHYLDKWKRLPEPQYPFAPNHVPAITDAEILEFRELLERAREYDKKHNEPECGLEQKKKEIAELAEKHGVKIDFL